MFSETDLEIFCTYGTGIIEEFLGDDPNAVTLVKLGDSEFVYPRRKQVILRNEPYFVPLGAAYAEYEFYFSLYRGILTEAVNIPDYVGFVQYDMDFREYVPRDLHRDSLVLFVPGSFQDLYQQNYHYRGRNCLDTIIMDLREIGINSEDWGAESLGLCSSFIVHRDTFCGLMRTLTLLKALGKLAACEELSHERYYGGMLERYTALILHSMKLEISVNHLPHLYCTGEKKSPNGLVAKRG